MDAIPDLARAAGDDPKLALLFRLYRSSLREAEIDNQILFQLILLEEASDGEPGGTLGARLRHLADRVGFLNGLDHVATEAGLVLPKGKDMIDVLVKLRNAAAHNGVIDEASLRAYRGAWAIPVIQDKGVLHRAIDDVIRYVLCAFVGHTPEAKGKLISVPEDGFTVRFD